MMVNDFQRNLLANGYMMGSQETPQMCVFVSPMNMERHLVITIAENYNFAGVHQDIAFLFGDLVNRYQTDQILFVLFAQNTIGAEGLTRNHFRCWLYNTTYNQLEVHPGQPPMFYNVRALLSEPYNYYGAPVSRPKPAPIRRIHNVFNFTNLFILINVLVHVILCAIGNTTDADFIIDHGGIYIEKLQEGEIYRLFTSMFMHFDWVHLLGNMFALFMIGRNLENMIGKVKFPIIYIVSGLGAGAVASLYYAITQQNIVCVGASGAIYGIAGALLWAFLINKNRKREIVLWQVIVGFVLTLGSGFAAEEGVSVSAHLGGCIIGFILALCMYRGAKKES